ncbi:hypothetical protein [Sulfurospirillum multivorans]|uniref:Uncharacterized protein n=2 Tax=Sulfurospirillum multivorans TaxID=66821 RepID=A0AA86AP04_SULMK|nr:hypothetical protein [Sulfurospirillum multivorans]AHJ13132.1 hypothetical protein SMUL_1877 [Sulfurospirillum multivorans DSM 12446]QEH06620.1 hypothetical protein SMN_1855 [Sulfurospirillum multivorans]
MANKKKQPNEVAPIVPPLMTRNISITLPNYLIGRLSQLEMSGIGGVNVSKTIRYIVEDYLGLDNSGKIFENLSREDIYMPVDLYVELMKIGKLTLKNRAAKGEVKVVSSFGQEYVQLSKEDAINFYAQLKMYREEVVEVKKRLTELEEAYGQMGDLIKIVNQLKGNNSKKANEE